MSKTLKTILIVVVILSVVALIAFTDINLGAIFASMAGGFAAFKAKLFNNSKANVEEQMAMVESEHLVKRQEWDRIKDEYDSRFKALQAKMEYIDYRTARISQEILDLDDKEAVALSENKNLTEEEILNRLLN